MGNGLPKRDLLVSRQHRILISSPVCKRLLGEQQAFFAAIKLTKLPDIFVDESVEHIEYFHLLFESHEVIYAEGTPTESLFTGPQALRAASKAGRREILELFPELSSPHSEFPPAALIPGNSEQKQVVAELVKTCQEMTAPRLCIVARESAQAPLERKSCLVA